MVRGLDGLAERSVIFVTLDSCRFDAAEKAATPHLDALGPLIESETAGTYTLPAHIAFFNGVLPRPVNPYVKLMGGSIDRLWRAEAVPPEPDKVVGLIFKGQTIMEHYHQRGCKVIGAGGVHFFNSHDVYNLLPSMFPHKRLVLGPQECVK
jgi:hypothetical protein